MKNYFILHKNKIINSLGLIILGSILLSCGGGGGSSSNGPTVTAVVSGNITYDRVPVTESGLDYSAIVSLPVRRTLVYAVHSSKGTILASTYTDNLGDYTFSVSANSAIKIVVYSVSKDPVITIQDHLTTSNGQFAKYVMESTAFSLEEGVAVTKSLNAASGYNSTTNELSGTRVAAPFALLDTCLKSADFFLENRTIAFPDLIVNWGKNNTTNSIGTSHWDGEALYILGDADVDTDEYDSHVVVHEWGHYFEATLGRSDSVGGAHSDGDVLDPRVAFSEGWGNALSAMVLYPDSVYKDTGGPDQGGLNITIDIDSNNHEIIANPDYKIGWFSESSVQSILYDMFDPLADDADEDWDAVTMSSGDIYDIFTVDCKNSESLVTLFTFVDGFLTRNPSTTSAISDLLAKHTIDPIVDEFGTDETNDGGVVSSLPIYKTMSVDTPFDLDFEESAQVNFLANIQYLIISGVSGSGNITATGSGSKTIELSNKGVLLDGSSGAGSIAITNFSFDETKTYILVVTNDKDDPSSQITITLTGN